MFHIGLDHRIQISVCDARGLISPNDEKMTKWKHSTPPNLLGSEIGTWMLENNLMEYYSEQMNKDLHQAAASAHQLDTKAANNTAIH